MVAKNIYSEEYTSMFCKEKIKFVRFCLLSINLKVKIITKINNFKLRIITKIKNLENFLNYFYKFLSIN